ncbi:MAG: formylglycine-generating enzyme family protein [Elusimicrobia bacterium]|nr:formylglycine-generating enzyme family protein [Elusimicrobiota bacterium]
MTKTVKASLIVLFGWASLGFGQSPDQIAGGVQNFFQPAKGIRLPIFAQQAPAVPKAQPQRPQAQAADSDILKPTDALDESKVGIAAKFISIQPGEFKMGSPSDEKDRDNDETQHPVKLTNFEFQATEVTQLQYFLVMGRNPSYFRKKENCDEGSYKVLFGLGLCVNHPVEFVSWNDAQEFIKELNRIQNKYTYRLPTEAEWEYAARANMPSGFPYSFGFNDTKELDNHGWYYGNSNSRTHAVATKKSNPLGLSDMHGNVWEWTQDFYGDYPTTAVTDPTGPTIGSYRVVRGGSWGDFAGDLRSAYRGDGDPGHRGGVGFRLARSPR